MGNDEEASLCIRNEKKVAFLLVLVTISTYLYTKVSSNEGIFFARYATQC